MSSFDMHLAGHTIHLEKDEFGTWLIDNVPYLDWIENFAPPEVVRAAARKGFEQATTNPKATEDAMERIEMPEAEKELMRRFMPEGGSNEQV